MEKLNLLVEQVNYVTEQGTFCANAVADDPAKALSNVVDPNTDFKVEDNLNSSSASPSRSFDLPGVATQTKVPGAPKRPLSSSGQGRPCSVSDSLLLQLMSLNQDYSPEMRNSGPTALPMVHAYVSVAACDKAAVNGIVADSQRQMRRLTGSQESMASLDRGAGLLYSQRGDAAGQQKLNDSDYRHLLLGSVDGSTTTADQVAWEFRAARDVLETASNVSGCSSRFEVGSNCSDRAETMSTISTVSGYEEEMFRIKRLLLMDMEATPPLKHKTQKELPGNETRSSFPKNVINGDSFSNVCNKDVSSGEISHLKSLLHDALVAKEKYRETAESSAREALDWQDKYQECSRQKAHVDGRLESLKMELEVLQLKLASCEKENKSRRAVEGKIVFQEMEKLTCEHARIQQVSRDVHSKNQELALQLELKNTALTHAKDELQECESLNEKLRIQLHELQVELDSKEGAIQGLKTKIASLHVESQAHLQANFKANNTIVRMTGEVESLNKSLRWYSEQLHACQEAKVKVQQELMTCQSNLMSQSHLVEKLKSEIVYLQHACEETHNRAIKEKESLMRKLEIIQADILEREAILLSQIQHGEASETLAAVTAKLKKIEEEKCGRVNNSEFIVNDLNEEINLLKNELNSKNAKLEASEADNAQLMIRITTLQKTLNERELYLQNLLNNYRMLESTLSKERESLKDKDSLYHDLMAEKIELEVALATETKEKKEVDEAIEKLRTDFLNVSRNYQAMKANLRLKENHVSNLEKLVKELQADKQNLTMKSEAVPIMENKVVELADQQKILEETVARLTETLSIREEQLAAQEKSIELHKDDARRKAVVVAQLESDKQELEDQVKKEKAALCAVSDHLLEFGNPLDVVKELELARHIRKNIKEMKHSSSQTDDGSIEINGSSDKWQLNHEDNINVQGSNDLSSKQNSHKNNMWVSDSFERLYSLVGETKKIICDSGIKDAEITDLHRCKLESIESLCFVMKVMNRHLNKFSAAVDGGSNIRSVSSEPNSVHVKDSNRRDTSGVEEGAASRSIRCVVSTATQTGDGEAWAHAFRREVERLKATARLSETEHREKQRRYEQNVRTLLKEVKEHMRGRRAAEKRIKELTARPWEDEELRARAKALEEELAGSQGQCEDLKQAMEKLRLELLESEKERGRLAEAVSKLPTPVASEEQDQLAEQLEHRTTQLQLQHSQVKVSHLEEELRKLKIIMKELRKEVFGEKCESSQLRKQVSSLRLGLETANEELDNKKVELGRSEAMCEVLRKGSERLQKELEREQRSHEDLREELEKLRGSLQDSQAKDPILADQIKTLGYHLHQKTQEVTALQRNVELLEARWRAKEQTLGRDAAALRSEVAALQGELAALRDDKFSLQTQAAELRAALQCSLDSSRLLKAKLETFGCGEDQDKLPDLTSSLPAPPARYDEARIAELLAQSSVLPHNKPLSNLRSCLDSLKLEMASLQEHITAKTSPGPAVHQV